MGRWEPDARGRLLRAALELFAEHGYEATTTAQIADRAGLTKTTLFRLFSDKREIVFQAQDELVALVTRGVDEAEAGSDALQLMTSGVRVLSGIHTDEHRRTGRVLDPILASSHELNERAVFKRFALTSALEDALLAHHVDSGEAGVLADLGIRAYYRGYDVWVASDDPEPLADYVQVQVTQLRDAMKRVTSTNG